MSNIKPTAKKTVKIKEADLIDMIDGILQEAVAEKEKQWIAEQAKKENNKTSILESKIADLEKKFNTLLEGKK